MAKVFEDYFSELQADMVSICLEYVENKADTIYIYCSNEDNALSCYYFYKVNNKIVKKHLLNDALDKNNDFEYDTSTDRQEQVMDILFEDLEKIEELCKKYSKDVPTEIKIVYDVKENSINADYRYDIVYSNDPEKTSDDVALEWFDELKKTEK